jgi:hypothetical protein
MKVQVLSHASGAPTQDPLNSPILGRPQLIVTAPVRRQAPCRSQTAARARRSGLETAPDAALNEPFFAALLHMRVADGGPGVPKIRRRRHPVLAVSPIGRQA